MIEQYSCLEFGEKFNINQLDEKEEEIADALISLGLGRLVGRTLAYLNNRDEATSGPEYDRAYY